ncbi:MAG: DivIVA domain-containing protein [Oscillospiraceae bacterium]
MTGKEILEEAFEKAGMRGYKADQVDNFLRQVAAFVDEQEVEKNDLTYKIKILADKIEEYKADEGNIRDALLGAQKLGTSILNEAKSKAESIGREARATSEDMLSQAVSRVDSMSKESLHKINMELADMKRECEKERINLDKIKREVSMFKASILKQYKAHLDLLSNLPTIADEQKVGVRTDINTEEKPIFKVEAFDQDAVENIFQRSQETSSFAESQTITSEILTNSKELEDEEMEQTREFTKEKDNNTDNENAEGEQQPIKINFATSENQRPNYMEKFGELKFGGFGKSDK